MSKKSKPKPDINTPELLPLEIIKNKILIKYNLENTQIETVKFKNTEKQRAVYKIIDNDENEYCLKKVYYNTKNLLFVYSAMEWLYRNEINLPRLLPTIDKKRFVIYKDMIFILTIWIEGEKCDFDNEEHRRISIETLASLHNTSRNFKPIKGSANRVGCVDFYESYSKHFAQLLENSNTATKVHDRFSKIYLKNLDFNLELAKLSLELSSKINNNDLSVSLCHGDYVNKNIIIQSNDAYIIDFDKCQIDYSAHDLSYFLRRLLKRESTNWDIEITLNILDIYLNNNNLTSSDIRYIVAYICFPQKFWKISRDYYRNIRKCNKKAFQTLLLKSIEKSSNQLSFAYDLIDILSQKNYI